MTRHWPCTLILTTLTCALVVACRTEEVFVPLDWGLNRMVDQPRYDAYMRNDFFPDRRAMRPPPAGTIRYDRVDRGPAQMRGREADGTFVRTIPVAPNRALVDMGEERFGRTCAACHGLLGDGNTIPAEHMRAIPPPTLHSDYVRNMPDGQLFATVSEGFGLMPGYSSQLSTHERWAVVTYVRVLQLSQHVEADALPDELRTLLREEGP